MAVYDPAVANAYASNPAFHAQMAAYMNMNGLTAPPQSATNPLVNPAGGNSFADMYLKATARPAPTADQFYTPDVGWNSRSALAKIPNDEGLGGAIHGIANGTIAPGFSFSNNGGAGGQPGSGPAPQPQAPAPAANPGQLTQAQIDAYNNNPQFVAAMLALQQQQQQQQPPAQQPQPQPQPQPGGPAPAAMPWMVPQAGPSPGGFPTAGAENNPFLMHALMNAR